MKKQSPAYDIQSVLQEMRDEYWRSLETVAEEETGDSRDYLVVRLGGERFAFPSSQAREVLKEPPLVRVPQVPAHICGVINLRGQIVAVTDLREILGLARREQQEQGRLVVVEAAGLVTALVTEEVEGIQAIAEADIEPLTEGLDFPREAAAGQLQDQAGLIVLLDLPRMLALEQFTVAQKGE